MSSHNPKDFYGIDDEIRELGYKLAKLSIMLVHNKKAYEEIGYTWSGGQLLKEIEELKKRLDWALKAKEKHHGKTNKESI